MNKDGSAHAYSKTNNLIHVWFKGIKEEHKAATPAYILPLQQQAFCIRVFERLPGQNLVTERTAFSCLYVLHYSSSYLASRKGIRSVGGRLQTRPTWVFPKEFKE